MDRDIFLFEKMNEIYDNKISFMIESLDSQLKINMLEAQYKVVTESGTKEDFEYLYMEAQEEVKQKKKCIFNGIIEWVIKIKDKLVDFFKEKKIEKEIDKLPDKFEIDEGYDKQFKGFKKFHEWLIKPINLFKQKKYKDLTVDLLKKGGQIVKMTVTVVLVGNIIYIGKSIVKKNIDWILKIFKTDCDSIVKMLKVNDDDSAPIKILKEIVGFINKHVGAAMNWCINICHEGQKKILDVSHNKLIEHFMKNDRKKEKDYFDFEPRVIKKSDSQARKEYNWRWCTIIAMNSTMISNRVLSKLTDKELEYYIYKKHAKEDAKFEVQRAKKS